MCAQMYIYLDSWRTITTLSTWSPMISRRKVNNLINKHNQARTSGTHSSIKATRIYIHIHVDESTYA